MNYVSILPLKCISLLAVLCFNPSPSPFLLLPTTSSYSILLDPSPTIKKYSVFPSQGDPCFPSNLFLNTNPTIPIDCSLVINYFITNIHIEAEYIFIFLGLGYLDQNDFILDPYICLKFSWYHFLFRVE